MKNTLKDLFTGKVKVGIWGLGYLGYTNLIKYTDRGLRCAATDMNKERINAFDQEGFPRQSHIKYWEIAPVIDKSLIEVIEQPEEFLSREDIRVIIICVQNESSDGKPVGSYLKKSFDLICNAVNRNRASDPEYRAPLIIVETSMEPSFFDQELRHVILDSGLKLGVDISVGFAPRFDWEFSEFYQSQCYRLVSACDDEILENICTFFKFVGDDPLGVSGVINGEIAAHLVNAKKHIESSFVNQLSMGYPDADIKKIIELLGIAGIDISENVGIGISGYRLPVASQLLLEGADRPEYLTILQEALLTDFSMPQKVVDLFVRAGINKVGVLGLSNKKNLRGHILSVSIKLIKVLKSNGIDVMLCDPLYTESEINEICSVENLAFPEGLSQCDGFVFMRDHSFFIKDGLESLCRQLKHCKLLVDNTGTFKNKEVFSSFLDGVDVRVVGLSGWLA